MFVKSKGEGTFQCIHVNVCFKSGIGLSHRIRVYGWLDWTVSQNLFHTERSCGSHGFDAALQTGICSTQLLRRLDHFSLFSPCCCLLVTCTELPYVPHAYLSEETERAQYHEGHMIHFTCEMGYISGPTIRYVCTSAGWVDIHKGPCYCEWQVSLFYSLFFGG